MTSFLDTVIASDAGELSEFELHLNEVEKVLNAEGMYSGLCSSCLGTGYVFSYKDGYVFVEYNEEKENPDDAAKIKLIKCVHDQDLSASLPY